MFIYRSETEWNKDRNSIPDDFVGLSVHGIKITENKNPRSWNIIYTVNTRTITLNANSACMTFEFIIKFNTTNFPKCKRKF